MRVDEDGLPAVAHTFGLGVRTPDDVPPGAAPDVVLDHAGRVVPGDGGMSVAPSVSEMLQTLLPKEWRAHGYPQARGPSGSKVWRMGTGAFTRAAVSELLLLEPDPPRDGAIRHGHVQPCEPMLVQAYREALANTRYDWTSVLAGVER